MLGKGHTQTEYPENRKMSRPYFRGSHNRHSQVPLKDLQFGKYFLSLYRQYV